MVVELKVKCEVEKALATVTIVRIKDSPKSNAEGSGKKEGKKKTGKQKTESNKTVTTKSEKVAAVLRTDKEAQKRTPTKDDTEKQVTLKTQWGCKFKNTMYILWTNIICSHWLKHTRQYSPDFQCINNENS